MPPKFKFTREQIVEAALGTSTKPILGLFESMEQLQQEVLRLRRDMLL